MRALLMAVSLVLGACTAEVELEESASALLNPQALAERRTEWRAGAPLCGAFPSKEGCEDGDTTLFNGLLCASGEELGCQAVQRSQGEDGRFWRSPRRVNGNLGEPGSFSRDMTMGVLLYLATTLDRGGAQRWLDWIDHNRPCTVAKPWGGCLVRGPHRVCRDDVSATCTITPGLWALMGRVWDRLGLPRHDEMRRWAATDTDLAALEASFTDPGYQLHLKAVAIYLKEKLDVQRTWRSDLARELSDRQPENPFFRYLFQGASDEVAAQVLASCPAPGELPARRFQWSWERADAAEAWRESMGWDCVFMANLLLR
jgi:hypothetical protein